MISIDMSAVQEYLSATSQVPIPHKYFLRPLHRSLALQVRPPTSKQKFMRRQVMGDLPVRTWVRHVDPLLPQPSSKLGI